MIDELQKAFALAAQQSGEEQAAIAARINEMIEADTRWDALLSDPEGLDMLEEMAEEAHQEYLRGETGGLERTPAAPPTLDVLYGALADRPISEIEHSPFPGSCDDL